MSISDVTMSLVSVTQTNFIARLSFKRQSRFKQKDPKLEKQMFVDLVLISLDCCQSFPIID